MSRLAKKPILVPEGTTIHLENDAIRIHGPKGSLVLVRLPHVNIALSSDGREIRMKQEGGEHQGAANIGTMWSLTRNGVHGTNEGFSKTLDIEGVGYRFAIEGKNVILNVGFSHPVRIQIPEGIEAYAEKNSITFSGMDKALVGKIASDIRAVKKPEPYLGKGIRYRGEIIRRKVGKKAAAGPA